ncbi:MAG TPA: extracellular solute-binding protein [Candidatus Luteococcus avicola]|nr:extracellular solute-binding protein [Candidatus Luteococcus avicola]
MSTTRRSLLQIAGVSGVLGLMGCRVSSTPSTPTPARSATVTPGPGNPFGLASGSSVSVLVDETEFGRDILERAATLLTTRSVPVRATTSGTKTIAADVLSRLAEDNPPDALLSGGLGGLSLAELTGQVTDLTPALTSSGQQLVAGTTAAGSLGDILVSIPWVREVRGQWYSYTVFKQYGWTAPTTWDELHALGHAARSKGMYLFGRGRQSAVDLARMVVASAIKEGGDEVRTPLETLAADCWGLAPVQRALAHLAGIIADGLVHPDGRGDSAEDALGRWAQDRTIAIMPGGSSVPWRSRQLAATDFQIALAPDPSVTAAPTLGKGAAQVGFGSWLAVPQQAPNRAGGLALVEACLDPAVAGAFTTEYFALTTVAGATGAPTGEHGRAALAAQQAVVEASGDSTCTWLASDRYGLGPDLSVLFTALMDADLGVATLTKELQALTDRVRDDPGTTHFPV